MPDSKGSIFDSLQRPVIVFVLLGFLALITVGVKARVWRNIAPGATIPQQLLPIQSGPAQMVRFTVYDAGIFPKEAHAGVGLLTLYIEDRTGSSAGLMVLSESAQPVAQVIRRPQRWRDHAQISLVPGRYTVYDASHLLNRATLIVEP